MKAEQSKWEFPVTQANADDHTYPCPTTGKNYKAQGYNVMRNTDGYAVHAFISTSNTNPQITKPLQKKEAVALCKALRKELFQKNLVEVSA